MLDSVRFYTSIVSFQQYRHGIETFRPLLALFVRNPKVAVRLPSEMRIVDDRFALVWTSDDLRPQNLSDITWNRMFTDVCSQSIQYKFLSFPL